MSEENPYAAPTADPTIANPLDGRLQLATPGERFVGSLIDGLIGGAVAFSVSFVTIRLGLGRPVPATALETLIGIKNLFPTLVTTVVFYIITMLIQFTFLKATGQTIGKKVAKTRIVTMEGKKPQVNDLVFKRYAFMSFLGILPAGVILSFVDALMVFRSDHRCLHDLIAGTQVIKVVPGEIIS